MGNPTVEAILHYKNPGGLTHGLPTGLREWDGEDHPVNVYDAKTGELLRIEGGIFFGDMADPNALPRFGRRY